MKYCTLGRTELRVSVIGLGTLAMGGQAYGPVDEEDAIVTIRQALDLGVNFLDTSDNYGLGRAEEIVGKAIQGRRDQVVLATKGGTPRDERGRITNDCRAGVIIKAVEASLRRLRTDYIDLYQIHLPDPETPFEETALALEQLRRAGKIRYIGLSNFWTAELKEWLSIGEIVSNQMPYNFLHRDIEGEILPLCRERKIGVIAYTPLLMGLFAGKLTPDSQFGQGDHRAAYPLFQGEPFRQSLRLIDRLRPLAEEFELTLAQLALRWVISRPGITCAIAGAKHPQQVKENVRAGEKFFTKEELESIDSILEEAPVEIPRRMPMKVVEVRSGPQGKVGVLAMGIKVKVPDRVEAGSIVQMDIVTGQIAETSGG